MVRQNKGFTLVELLAVIAIIALMALVLVPSISGVQSSGDFNRAISDISSTLTQARLYAMAHNTYVFVGFEETNAQVPDTLPQTSVTPPTVGGRVYIDVVASQDGTPGYDTTSPTAWTLVPTTPAGYPNAGYPGLVTIQKPISFNNLHLNNLTTVTANANGLTRPVVDSGYQLGDPSFPTVPPGLDIYFPPQPAPPRFTFTRVLQFDPQGAVSILGTIGGVAPTIEIGMQPTHGNVLPANELTGNGNQAAIQVDGTTGAVTIYRQ